MKRISKWELIKKLLKSRLFWILIAWILSMWFVYWFRSTYHFVSPIKKFELKFQWVIERNFVSPIPKPSKKTSYIEVEAQIAPLSPTVTPKPKTEYDIVMAQPHGKVLWNIYMLESTRGKNDGCRLNGKGYAGFGVMDNNHKVVCYETFEKAVERAEYWLVKIGIDKDLDSALCAWNTGTPQPMCNYSMTYHTL